MFVRVILLAVLIFVALNLLSYVRRQEPAKRKALIIQYGSYALIIAVILLAATGRLHWIGAVIAAAIPFLKGLFNMGMRFLPVINWLRKQKFANSVMSTRLLRLVVNVSTGSISGAILSGRFAGSSLDDLSQEQLQELLQEYQQQDPESARLLMAYLQRRFQQGAYQQQSSGGGANSGNTPMDRSEALQILGLEETATEKDIIAAHRKLMQKVHPDRGGSDYLAAKINQAKDFLLKA
ncbi:DnaJ domain-containing protein [Pseudomaricurvus alkylphenolicus]|uniref:DnaJ domain-containing protein n=1 Tax=Pseudomaricurvus alkylphenolicus TaxID=1306991 RepID=UPI001423F260|nr:DnaJ domain-containing protein [Pseudomaricurvus alkylphenolicus]NIB44538.1 DnaJ domain-containing protein [Pseudomaricurvus alkylphenolicus]